MTADLILLDLIISDPQINQRELAKRMTVSLGTVNNMLKKFVDNHYLKVNKSNPRRIRYNLTDKGLEYRNHLMYDYVDECFRVVGRAKLALKKRLIGFLEKGNNCFLIVEPKDEFYRIVKLSLMELSYRYSFEYEQVEAEVEGVTDTTLLLGWRKDNRYQEHSNYVNLVDLLVL